MVSRRYKERRDFKRKQQSLSVPFALPSKFRITIKQPITPKLNVPLLQQPTIRLPQHSHIGIPNPEYQAGSQTPKYAAFRISKALTPSQRSALRYKVNLVWATRLKSRVIKSRGSRFHQWWFGVWCRYAQKAFLSADSTNKRSQPTISGLLALYDWIFGRKPRWYLHQMDPETADSMTYAHRRISRYLLRNAAAEKVALGSKKGKKRQGYSRTVKALSETHTTRRAIRLGGMGTMLAVSWGEGTDWHVDAKDYGNHYTIISILGQPGELHLPELGYSIPVKAGDMVGFLAHRYLHKLSPIPSSQTACQSKQIVFTCWSDALTEEKMAKEYKHFSSI